MMQSRDILSYFTRHKTAANLLLILMLVFGLYALTKIRSQFFPDVVINDVTVSVQWENAGAEDVDAAIVAVMEPALLLVEGVEESTARSTEGQARITLEFEPNWDMARAAADVETAVGLISNLPEGVDDPVVRRGVWRDRVTDVIIAGPISVEQLGRFADELAARLFSEGISRTTIRGVAAPLIEVRVDQSRMIRHNVSFAEIANLIEAETRANPAGDVADGTARIRSATAKRTREAVEAFVLKAEPDGREIRIGDIAEVALLGADRGRSYFRGEDNAVSMRVDRSAQGDAIEVQSTIERIIAEVNPTLPEGVRIELIRTRTEAINQRLDILYENGLLGLGLVLALLFLFLSARTAFWVAAGIPAAMFAAIALMYAFGLTINMISLFALIICLGIVVDDAIVVGEHADFRARRLGEAPLEAAQNAAKRMAMPIFSATVTTVIAFFGLTIVGGRFGSLIADIPFTVIIVLIASLAECFLILPHHMSRALAKIDRLRWYDLPSYYVNIGFSWFRERIFRPGIRLIVAFRYPALAATILLLVLSVNLFRSGNVTFRFINFPEQNSIAGNIAMLPGAERADTVAMVNEMIRAVEKTAKDIEGETGLNPVSYVLGEVGGNTGRPISGTENKDQDLLGAVAIELIDADERPETPSALFLSRLQDEIRRHPRLETLSFRRFRFGPGGDAIALDLYGADGANLKEASEALKAELAQFPEVSAIEDSIAFDKEEIVIELTPRAQALGFTKAGLSQELRTRINGVTAARFPSGARTAEIRVVASEETLRADFLTTLRVRSPMGEYIPLADLVTLRRDLGFSSVLRENGLRVVTVSADLDEEDPNRAEFVTKAIYEEIMPNLVSDYGIGYQISGQAAQERAFLQDAILGYALCLIGIYLTLAWIFSSWFRPLIVMLIIPFGLIGAIYGHWVHNVPLSMFSIIGLIGMSGIIINDSIVLITTIDKYSERRAIRPALIDAVVDRFRPVLLTTATTVIGLMPLLFETSRQAQFLMPTVITLCYGLGVGMFIVLLIVPSLVMMQSDLTSMFKSARRLIFYRRIRKLIF